MAVFSDTLYATVSNPAGVQVWRSDTGDSSDWAQVASNGFNSDPNNGEVCGVAELNDYLYMAVAYTTDGMEIWRTNNGTGWNQANQNGFGDAANGETGGLATFNNYLYSGTRNNVTGAQVWRSNNGTTWEQVVGNGFGDADSYKTNLLFSFEDYIYSGVNNNTTGIQVWRSSDGLTWHQIISDGFGDSNNVGLVWSNSTTSYQNTLHIGTWNPSTGGEIWQQLRQVFLPLVVK